MIKSTSVFILIILISLSVVSQENTITDTVRVSKIEITDQPAIMNIRHRIEDEKIIVIYDFIGRDMSRLYNISLIAKVSPYMPIHTTGIYNYHPGRISGDVGKRIMPGRGKQIIWDYKREIEVDLTEDDVRFEISIQEYRDRSSFSASLLRSAVLPGWGQLYRNKNTKGAFFMFGSFGAGAFFYFAHMDYTYEVDNYNESLRAFNEANSPIEESRLRGELNDSYEKLADAYGLRNIALYTMVGIYALNIIDALIFHSRGNDIALYLDANKGIRLQPRLIYDTHNIIAGLQFTF